MLLLPPPQAFTAGLGLNENDLYISYLPLAHSFERLVNCAFMMAGGACVRVQRCFGCCVLKSGDGGMPRHRCPHHVLHKFLINFPACTDPFFNRRRRWLLPGRHPEADGRYQGAATHSVSKCAAAVQ